MSLKIDSNQSAVVHHIIDGPVVFPYAIDAHSAVSRFPKEWSDKPWCEADAAKARKERGDPAIELTPAEQTAIDEHTRAVAEANERLKAFHEKKAAEKAEADLIARDEALVVSAPPRPDLTARRPFGRKGELTAAEKKMVADKASADKEASFSGKMTT